ncbi:putative [histone H3]-lysine(4) N-trimethyltransferase chromatin remodeling SET family [Helianthus annuus]|nr:putative [histone H3]-lysine(4) N-trimethyltransferase chromatin remodeling SET family [Helianthus annuus]
MVIDATFKGNKSRYINHSSPNTEMLKMVILVLAIRRNVNITSVMCPFCDIYEETVDHLFTACVVSN